jgi:hypothetical protein
MAMKKYIKGSKQTYGLAKKSIKYEQNIVYLSLQHDTIVRQCNKIGNLATLHHCTTIN